MGFRHCSVCNSLLFAAKAATLTTSANIILTWSCDSCDNTFETRAKPVSTPIRPRAAA
jgi:transcription elongation factor Elf1